MGYRIDYLHKIVAVIFMVMAFSACHDIEADLSVDDEIRLKASVASNVIATKGVGVISSAYEDPLYLGFVRIDETVSGYPMNFRGQPAMTATMQGISDIKDIEFNETYQTFRNENYGVKYASWYPWYENAADESTGPYKYDDDKAEVIFPIDGSTDILYGSVTNGTKAKGFNTIEYSHALAKYRITVYALVPYDENKQPVPQYMPDVIWGSVESVTVEDMPSQCLLTLPVDGGSDYSIEWPSETTVDYKEGQEGDILLASIPIDMDEAATVAEIIAAPPVDGILKVNVKTSKTTTSQQITIARDFKPGRHYDVRLRFSNHGLINADVEAMEWEDAEDITIQTGGEVYYDLSSTATANCYMISSANYNYCFDVTVKGNGINGVIDGSDHRLNTGYVDVLWMDSSLKDKFRLSSHYPSQGRVLFALDGSDDKDVKTIPPEMEGNVLIGAYADDSKSTLLWTWHLWICDRPQIQSYKNGFTVQDRDLGAVDYIPGTPISRVDGLYYQWGRPTPFPIGRTLSQTFDISSSTAVPDVQTAISTPTVFYDDAVVSSDGNTPRLWGWRSAAEEYIKTIYDPCPPGYRVPSKRLWAELRASDYAVEGHNVKFSVIDGYSVYYPISGYYNGPTKGVKYYWNGTPPRNDKVGAFMWSATYDEEQDNPYLMTYEYHQDGTSGMTVRPAMDTGPALPVRCVSERSTPHVENLSSFQTANSYIVSNEGYYKFDVSVRGNGVGHLVAPGSTESIDITEGLDVGIEVDRVGYLWWQGDMETGNDISEPPVILDFDGKPDNGFVTFHIDNYREGNLILAGYDPKGEILWTWHLWLTDAPTARKSKDYEVMDRFLGATYAPGLVAASSLDMSEQQWKATLGFCYQWGRKDPFPSSDGTNNMAEWWWYNKENKSWEGKTDVYEKQPNTDRGVRDAVKEPMIFHQSQEQYPVLGIRTSFNNARTFNQYFTADKNITNSCYPSMTSGRESLWGYSSAKGLGKTSTKTMYDPCPPGYSVVYYHAWAGGSEGDSYTYYDGWSYGLSKNEYNSSYGGIMLDRDKFSGAYDYTWYPFTGYIDASTAKYKEVNEIGRFYSSTPAGNGSRSFFYNSDYTGQAIDNIVGLSTSFAIPVRCQKD